MCQIKISTPNEKFYPPAPATKVTRQTIKPRRSFRRPKVCKVRCDLCRCRGRLEHPFAARSYTAAAKRERTSRFHPRFFGSKKAPVTSSPRFLAVSSHFLRFLVRCAGGRVEVRWSPTDRLTNRPSRENYETPFSLSLGRRPADLVCREHGSHLHRHPEHPQHLQRPRCRDTLNRVPSCFLKPGWSCSVPAP